MHCKNGKKILNNYMLIVETLKSLTSKAHHQTRIINHTIGLYRENAIAIESEANDSFGGLVYYVTMQIPEFTRNERNFHCDVSHITPDRGSRPGWRDRSDPDVAIKAYRRPHYNISFFVYL